MIATLEFKWSDEQGVFMAVVTTPHGSAEFPVPSKVSGVAQLPAGLNYADFVPHPVSRDPVPVKEGGGNES